MATKKETSAQRKARIAADIKAQSPTVVANAQADRAGALFIGIDAGSKTEERYKGLSQTRTAANQFGAKTPFGPLGFAAYKTGSTLEQLAGYGPDDIYALQVRLHDAGLLDNFTPTQLDKTTRNAFKDLLATSNASMKTWQQTLDDITAVGGTIDKQDGRTRAPLTVELTNPDDLKSVAQKVAQTLYGGNLPEADLERFVNTFHGMESGAQSQAYGMAESGGTVVAPPNASVAAESQIRAEHPDQVAATAFGARMGDIISTFTGGR
jgi:acyl-CoA synthetase (AMP-forming)/AMP-acid ligase II